MSIYFAVIALAVVFASALVVDGGRKMSRISEAVNLADNGARACAQSVAAASILETDRVSDPILDQAEAVASANRYFQRVGLSTYQVGFDSTGTRCIVTVTLDVPTIGIPMAPVSATQSAVGRTG